MINKTDLTQRSSTFLAPGTSFVEDSFSTDQGAGVAVGGGRKGSGGNGEPQMKLPSLAGHSPPAGQPGS